MQALVRQSKIKRLRSEILSSEDKVNLLTDRPVGKGYDLESYTEYLDLLLEEINEYLQGQIKVFKIGDLIKVLDLLGKYHYTVTDAQHKLQFTNFLD